MQYDDYANSNPTRAYVSEELFNGVHEHIKKENRAHIVTLMQALSGNRKIDAIRALKSIADIGLKEAKDLVERLMNKEPQTIGGILKEAVKPTKEPKYCVVRGYQDVSCIGRSLFDCQQDAEYILKNYPEDAVRICEIISESKEITTCKMVDL